MEGIRDREAQQEDREMQVSVSHPSSPIRCSDLHHLLRGPCGLCPFLGLLTRSPGHTPAPSELSFILSCPYLTYQVDPETPLR